VRGRVSNNSNVFHFHDIPKVGQPIVFERIEESLVVRAAGLKAQSKYSCVTIVLVKTMIIIIMMQMMTVIIITIIIIIHYLVTLCQ
jgi:hypothetical protein